MSTHPVVHPVVEAVTARVVERSRATRAAYLARTRAAAETGPARGRLACANLAHGFAAAEEGREKQALRSGRKPNLAIVTSYNDMLSAHQPYVDYPPVLKRAAVRAGGLAHRSGQNDFSPGPGRRECPSPGPGLNRGHRPTARSGRRYFRPSSARTC